MKSIRGNDINEYQLQLISVAVDLKQLSPISNISREFIVPRENEVTFLNDSFPIVNVLKLGKSIN